MSTPPRRAPGAREPVHHTELARQLARGARRGARAAPLLLITSLLACGSGELGMSDSTYVRTMAGLQRVQREQGSPAQRDSVLQANGVTVEALEQAAEFLASHPDEAAELWRAIDRESRRPR